MCKVNNEMFIYGELNEYVICSNLILHNADNIDEKPNTHLSVF